MQILCLRKAPFIIEAVFKIHLPSLLVALSIIVYIPLDQTAMKIMNALPSLNIGQSEIEMFRTMYSIAITQQKPQIVPFV